MIDYTLPLDQLPDPLPIEPLRKPFDVTITPPGSKSITCRAYVLAALAKGESKIIRPLRADDTDHLLNALCTLGAEARWVKSDQHDGEDVLIKGVAGRFPRGGNLYMGEGGTPTRFMIACACLASEPVTIDASPRMRERPIAEGVDMLRQLGAKIEYLEAEARLPVRVVSSAMRGGELRIGRTASSQFVSAVALVANFLPDGVNIYFEEPQTSASYISLTADVVTDWGGQVESNLLGLRVRHEILGCDDYPIQPDASGATYWWAAEHLVQGRVNILGLEDFPRQPDYGFLEVLHRMDQASHAMWSMPDASMSLAVVAARHKGTTTITGLRTLRVKETDRIAALANEMRKVGCTVATGEDWIEITPVNLVARRSASCESPQRSARNQQTHTHPHDAERRATTDPIIIETYNDHRMAMAFAVLGLNPPNGVPLAIRNPKCVAKSYPGFWKDFAKLYQ